MASIERTAYPRFKRQVSARELRDVYTVSPDEIEWAQGLTRSDEHLLSLVVFLKCFQRLGYSPGWQRSPARAVQRRLDKLAAAAAGEDNTTLAQLAEARDAVERLVDRLARQERMQQWRANEARRRP